MLSNHERKTLREVERRLMAEDPEFARSFHAREQYPLRDHRRRTATVVIVVAVLLGALMLVAGSLNAALASAAAAGLIWVAWRYSDGPGRRTT